MRATLPLLVAEARLRVSSGYYDVPSEVKHPASLRRSLMGPGLGVIAEVKLASPSAGVLCDRSAAQLLSAYIAGRASGLSVLTEPTHFHGSLDDLRLAARQGLPVLMKDFFVDKRQIEAAASCGASAILLIHEALKKDEVRTLMERAHGLGLEVVLESCTLDGLRHSLKTEADIIALNQRDLATMEVDPMAHERILPRIERDERPLLVMSGIATSEEAVRARASGADAVLVGSALASSRDPVQLLREMRSVP